MVRGQTIANLVAVAVAVAVAVTVTVGASDKVTLFNAAGNLNLFADLAGYYAN